MNTLCVVRSEGSKEAQVVRHAGGPDVEHLGEAIRPQFEDLGLDNLRRCREVAYESQQRNKVVPDMHAHGFVLNGTKPQQSIDKQITPAKLRARLRRREETPGLCLRQLFLQRQ